MNDARRFFIPANVEPEMTPAVRAFVVVSRQALYICQRVWAVGRFEYMDAFKQPHYTNFRFKQMQFPGPQEWELEITAEGNDSN
jgi:hypothetical protein